MSMRMAYKAGKTMENWNTSIPRPTGSLGIAIPGCTFRTEYKRDGKLLSVSPTTIEFFDYASDDEILALNVSDLVVDEDIFDRIEEALSSEPRIYESTAHFRRKNGDTFLGAVNVNALSAECGDTCYLIFSVIDLTEPNRIHKELEMHKDIGYQLGRSSSLDEALEHLLDFTIKVKGIDCMAVYMVDHEQKLLTMRGHRNVTGNFIKEARVLPLAGFFPDIVENKQAAYVDSGNIYEDDREMLELEGFKAVAVIPMVHQNKTLALLNIASKTDDSIPEQSRQLVESIALELGAMLARFKSEEEVRESRERYRFLVENISDVIYRTSAETEEFEYLSPNFERLLGYTPDDIREMGGRVEFMRKAIGDDFEPMQTHYRELAGLNIKKDVSLIESWWTAKDGSRHYIQDHWHAFYEDGTFVGTGGALRDITELQNVKEQLQRVQRLESLGVLAGGIAHDFNNILTSIMGNISLLQTEDGVTTECGMILKDAEKACTQAKKLTSQLLTFSHGGSPIRELHSVPELVRDAAELCLSHSPSRAEFDFQEDLWAANLDGEQFSQALRCLIINADQSMSGGGIVKISCENTVLNVHDSSHLQPGKYLRITVTDSGTGISSDNLEKIFDPFFSTKNKAHGLGLTISYSIIRNHGGTITVESRPGKGSSFQILLPVGENFTRETKPSRAADENVSLKILLMDDDPSVRRVLVRMLTRFGHEVVESEEGSGAIEEYRKALEGGRRFDYVVMDLTIPGGMGGKEAVKEILEIDPEAYVLVSSGYSNDPVLSDYQSYGFRGMLSKPYRVGELREALGIGKN